MQSLQIGTKQAMSRLFLAPTSLGRHLSDPHVVRFFDTVRQSPVGMMFIGGIVFEREETTAYKRYTGLADPANQKALATTIQRQQADDKVTIVQLCCFASYHQSKTCYIPGVACYNPERMEEVIEAFIWAAKVCFDCGADGVELHATHGSFLNQYISPHFNHRQDTYGIQDGQFRVVRRIIEAIKSYAPTGILGIRINAFESVYPGMQNVHQALIPLLEHAGIDFIDISSGLSATFENGQFQFASDKRSGNRDVFPRSIEQDQRRLQYGATIRELTQLPLLYTGGVDTLQQAETILTTYGFDAIGFSRAFIADPAFLTKEVSNRAGEIKTCIRCNVCAHFPATCILWDEAEGGFPEEKRKEVIRTYVKDEQRELAEGIRTPAE
jgi:2,4-dienoyl-CoA reductase-like NADH-dependent reductase (Old Yellow Enzyme family)